MEKNINNTNRPGKGGKTKPQRIEPHIDRTTAITDVPLGPEYIIEAARHLVRCWVGDRALQCATIPVTVGHDSFVITITRQ